MRAQDRVLMECRSKLQHGAKLEEIIRTLREGGFSKAHSIKALVDLGQASMNEAKQIVHNSPTWVDVRARDDVFHRKLDE